MVASEVRILGCSICDILLDGGKLSTRSRQLPLRLFDIENGLSGASADRFRSIPMSAITASAVSATGSRRRIILAKDIAHLRLPGWGHWGSLAGLHWVRGCWDCATSCLMGASNLRCDVECCADHYCVACCREVFGVVGDGGSGVSV
jgi:hypothetical protein